MAMQPLLQPALQNNDPTKLDIAAFVQHYGQHAELAIQAAQAVVADSAAVMRTIQQEAYGLVGGQAQWDSLTTNFKGVAPELVPAVQTMVNNRQLAAAVAFMQQTLQHRGVSTQAMQGVTPNNPAVSSGLSEADFRTKVQELHKKYPYASFEPHTQAGQELAELFNQRRMSLQ